MGTPRMGAPRIGTPHTGIPRTGEKRAPAPGERRPPGPEGAAPAQDPVPSLQRYAVRIRWATWIGLAVIAIRLIAPRPDGWRRWSDAAAALADVEQARTAALLYYQAASRQWPPPGRRGVVPAGMLPFLSGDVSFSRTRYRLAWESAADTVSGARVIDVSVTGDDPRLSLTMAQRAPAVMPFVVSQHRFVALIASGSGR